MFPILFLLACKPDTIGMQIRVGVYCTNADGSMCELEDNYIPCRCNPHQFDRAEGRVHAARYSGEKDDPEVVFTVEYDANLCSKDLVVTGNPTTVESIWHEPLYEVDYTAALIPVDDAPLIDQSDDTLIFSYTRDGQTIGERHDIAFRQDMKLDSYRAMRCCGAPLPASLAAALVAMAAALGRTGRRSS